MRAKNAWDAISESEDGDWGYLGVREGESEAEAVERFRAKARTEMGLVYDGEITVHAKRTGRAAPAPENDEGWELCEPGDEGAWTYWLLDTSLAEQEFANRDGRASDEPQRCCPQCDDDGWIEIWLKALDGHDYPFAGDCPLLGEPWHAQDRGRSA